MNRCEQILSVLVILCALAGIGWLVLNLHNAIEDAPVVTDEAQR
jgi:hypothetical protein